MSEIIELFKTRLAQLKKVLERDGKIAEELFDKAMQLDKSEALKKEVMDIITSHKFKIKKGYISLPSETVDREAVVREFFRETFDSFVKAFDFDMTELVTKEPEPPKSASALKLFEMQDELGTQAETGMQAFESTMQELDTIDTSIPLESIMDVSPAIEEGTNESVISEQVLAEGTEINPEVPSEKIEEPESPASAIESEEERVLQAPIKPVPPSLQPKKVPSPPARSVPSPPARQVPSPPARQVPSPPIKPVTPSLRPKQVPSPPAKQVPSPTAKQVPSPTAKQVPSPKVQKQPPAEISYTYYVCNRCGAEISKMDIKQSGSYLECPRCNFTFSRAEATVIQKRPGSQPKAGPQKVDVGRKEEQPIEETTQGESFNLFSDKGDESLVRPSDLFKDRQDMFINSSEKEVESKQALQPHEKHQKTTPGERLVRPSEYLGQMQENVGHEGNASEQSASPEVTPGEGESPSMKSSGSPESPVQEEMNTGTTSASEEPTVEPPTPARQVHQVPRPAAPVPVKPKYGAEESQMIGDHLVKPSERLVRPSELREIAQEKKETEEKCPRCGSTKFTKIQDRTKIVSYNPLLYGSKKKCTLCSFIFD